MNQSLTTNKNFPVLYNAGKATAILIDIATFQQIEQILDNLETAPQEALLAMQQLKTRLKPTKSQVKEIPPIYKIHEQAIDMGIPDLAQNLDHYLYGADKQDE